MAYTKINWQNLPSTQTPVNETNLKHMDDGIYDNDQAIATKATLSDIQDNLVNVSSSVDEDYRVNLIESNNLFGGGMYNGAFGTGGTIQSSTTRISNVNVGGTSKFYLEAGTYTISASGLSHCTAMTKDSSGTILQDFTGQWNALPFTITLTQSGYLYFVLRNSDNTNISPDDYTPIVNTGSSAQTLIPRSINVDNETYTETIGIGTSVDSRNRVNVLYSHNLLEKKNIGWVRNNNDNPTDTSNNNNARIRTFNLLKLEGGKTYTLSGIPSGVQSTPYIKFYATSTSTSKTSDASSSTFVVPTNAPYVIFQFSGENFTDATNTLMANSNLMLVEGSTALPYEPYITPSINVDGEEIYNQNNLDIIDITNKITYASGWSIDTGKVFKQGKHIFGTIQIKTPSSLPASTNSQNVIVLPYTLSGAYIMGGFTASGDKWSMTNGLAYIYIGSNGSFTLTNSSTATYFRVQIDVMEA